LLKEKWFYLLKRKMELSASQLGASNYSGWRYRWNDWRFKRIYSYFSDYGAWFLTKILSNRCGINSIRYCVNGLRLVFCS
jgi:hypothetical protein